MRVHKSHPGGTSKHYHERTKSEMGHNRQSWINMGPIHETAKQPVTKQYVLRSTTNNARHTHRCSSNMFHQITNVSYVDFRMMYIGLTMTIRSTRPCCCDVWGAA